MIKKDIIVSVANIETRIALLEEDRLNGLYVERAEDNSLVGNIYKGRVLNLISGLKAAFVNIGMEKNGFLPLDEIPFSDFPELFENDVEVDEKLRPEEIKLKENQETIVQITKDAYGVKGPRVTSYISLPGRYMVLLVNARNVGVSRKIRQRRDRDNLFRIGREIKPEGMGLIIRTAASTARPEELRSEARWLKTEWERAQHAARSKTAPVLVYHEPSTLIKLVRDSFNHEVRNLIIDSEARYREIQNYLSKVSPRMRSRTKLYRDNDPIFTKYGIEDQIKNIFERKVWLPSGGYIVLDQAEALMAIDVNTGKSSREKQAERLALATNLEAIREVVRQLRLRDIGGMVVVDLIDMERRENTDRVLREFKNLLHMDKARYRIGSISEFGLLEFTRERSRTNLTLALSESCPACKGRGRIISRTSMIGYIERWFIANSKNVKGKMIELQTAPRVADFLSLFQTDILAKIAREHNMILKLKGDYSIMDDDFKVVII